MKTPYLWANNGVRKEKSRPNQCYISLLGSQKTLVSEKEEIDC